MAAAEAEAKEVLIAPEKHICKCAYIINVSSDKSLVVADLIDEGTKKRFKAKGKNTIPPYVAPMLTVEVTGVWEESRRSCRQQGFSCLPEGRDGAKSHRERLL